MRLNSLSTRLYNTFQSNPFLYVFLPLSIYWIFLFVLTTIPTDAIPQIFTSQDKIEHLIAYFILSYLLLLSLHFQRKFQKLSQKPLIFALVFLIIYATVDEVHQIFVPGRFCDIYDWSADVLGGVIGLILSNIFIQRNIREKKL